MYCKTKVVRLVHLDYACVQESEVIGLRLKVENLERSIIDQRIMSNGVSERNVDILRQLEHVREKGQEDVAVIDDLKTQLAQRLVLEESSAAERETLELQVTSMKAEIAASRLLNVESRQELVDRADELTEQLNELQAKYQKEESQSKLFDDYKKRAQVALKKVTVYVTLFLTLNAY